MSTPGLLPLCAHQSEPGLAGQREIRCSETRMSLQTRFHSENHPPPLLAKTLQTEIMKTCLLYVCFPKEKCQC